MLDMTNFPHKSKTFEGTWLDRAGKTWNYQSKKGIYSKRINIHIWDDTPDEVTIKVIEGDGRRGPDSKDFTEFANVSVPIADMDGILQEFNDTM